MHMQVPLVAYVGRLTGQKGMDVLLSALPALFKPPSGHLSGQWKQARCDCIASSQAYHAAASSQTQSIEPGQTKMQTSYAHGVIKLA